MPRTTRDKKSAPPHQAGRSAASRGRSSRAGAGGRGATSGSRSSKRGVPLTSSAAAGWRKSSATRGPAGPNRGRSRARTRSTGALGPIGELGIGTLILLGLATIALVALVPTVNSYLMQQQELERYQQQVSEQKNDITELEAEIARWDDPTFVAAQARDRLLFAMPGETQYRLTDSRGNDVPLTEAEKAKAEAAKPAWFGAMWNSTVAASQSAVPEGRASIPTVPAPQPAAAPEDPRGVSRTSER